MRAFAAALAGLFALGAAQEPRPVPAFPGAQGWGSTTPGGRGGRILFVTSLADRGPGTLREAVETPGPRTILFRVGGVIRLEKPLSLSGEERSHVTIAGQSAPGGGVALTGAELFISRGVHDVVIRHLRFRACGEGPSVNTSVRRVVIDHCSFSWAYDENLDLYVNVTDVTLSWNVFAEGLHDGGHVKGAGHSCGLLVGKGSDRVSIHHNFLAGNEARNPLLLGGDLKKWRDDYVVRPSFDFRNNVVYNARGGSTAVRNGAQINVVGNVYERGPSSLAHVAEVAIVDINDEEQRNDSTRLFVEDNSGPHLAAGADPFSIVYDEVQRTFGPRPEIYRLSRPVEAPAVETFAAKEVVRRVLPAVGALPRDETDARLVKEFDERKGSAGAPGRRRDTPFPPPAEGQAAPDGDNDGMPDAWESRHGLLPADSSDAWADPDRDGYGNLEEFLNGTDPRKAD